mgnify:FL=1|jgi:hypothetical protein
MIDKLILRAIEESFELRFLLSSNSEIDQSSRKYFEDNGFKLYFYQDEEDSSFNIRIRDASDTKIIFGYNSSTGSIGLTEGSLQNAAMNKVVNIIVRAQEEFKSKKTSKRKLTLN